MALADDVDIFPVRTTVLGTLAFGWGIAVLPRPIALTQAFPRMRTSLEAHFGEPGAQLLNQARLMGTTSFLSGSAWICGMSLLGAAAKEAAAEVWEYIGAPGGPNEFLMRQRSSGLVMGTGVASLVAAAVPGLVDHTKLVSLVAAGTGTAGGEGERGFPNLMLRSTPPSSPTGTLTYLRNKTTLPASVVAHHIEFTGSNWTVVRVRAALANTPGVDQLIALPTDIGDWSTALVMAANLTFGVGSPYPISGTPADLGVTVRPGPDTASVYVRTSPAASSAGTVSRGIEIQIVQHAELFVTRFGSLLDGRAPLGPVTVADGNLDVTEALPTAMNLSIGTESVDFTLGTPGKVSVGLHSAHRQAFTGSYPPTRAVVAGWLADDATLRLRRNYDDLPQSESMDWIAEVAQLGRPPSLFFPPFDVAVAAGRPIEGAVTSGLPARGAIQEQRPVGAGVGEGRAAKSSVASGKPVRASTS